MHESQDLATKEGTQSGRPLGQMGSIAPIGGRAQKDLATKFNVREVAEAVQELKKVVVPYGSKQPLH